MAHLHNQVLPAGTRLGVYEIKEALKVDAFDIAYLAWNHHIPGEIEILEYFPHDFAVRAKDGHGVEPKLPIDKEKFDVGLEVFVVQAEALIQIEHANIVKAENVLDLNGTAYLIMAHQEGVPLSQLAKAPAAIADTELTFILVSILNALQQAHESNIVHGGIQPEAILLGKNGEPLLTNFVDARMTIAEYMAMVSSELTPGYTPPELYGRSREPGPASDFYSLGATLYYCVTHSQPVDAQARKMALDQGKPDPLVPLSGTADSPYNAGLLQAIDWMLRPEYNERPQSASDILALLNSEPGIIPSEQIVSGQDSADTGDSYQTDKNPLLPWVFAGIIGLAALGFWLTQKPSGTVSEYEKNSATSQSSLPSKADQSRVTANMKGKQTAALTAMPPSQKVEPVPVQSDAQGKSESNKPLNQPKPDGETKQLQTGIEDKRPKNTTVAKSAPIPASTPTAQPEPARKPELKEMLTGEHKSVKVQKMAAVDKPPPRAKKQKIVTRPNREGSIQGYLAAAKRAMKQRRLTQPPGDNAYKYYQMALAKDPGNAEAQAGLHKIVDKYAWVIKESKAEGKLDKAKRVLKKAESVLPNHPKLQQIHKELDTAND